MDNNPAQPNNLPPNEQPQTPPAPDYSQPAPTIGQPMPDYPQPQSQPQPQPQPQFEQQPPVVEQPQPSFQPQPDYNQQPQPMMPGQGTPYAPQPVVPKQPMDPKTKKLIIILCSVGGGLLLLGIAALIILPIILKVDYKSTYDLADIANDIRYDMQGSDSCGGVISYVNSSYQTKASYQKFVSKCQSDIAAFRTAVNDLAGSSGVQRDAEIKQEWEAFKTSYDAAFPAYESLVGVYSDWHSFIAGWYEATADSSWWETMNESKAQSLSAPLTNSNNDALKKYGDDYITTRWKQISAYQAYQKARNAYYDSAYNAPNRTALRNDMNSKLETYNGLNQDYKTFREDEPDIKDTKKLVGIDLDKSENQFLSKFGNAYSIISSKYLEEGLRDTLGL